MAIVEKTVYQCDMKGCGNFFDKKEEADAHALECEYDPSRKRCYSCKHYTHATSFMFGEAAVCAKNQDTECYMDNDKTDCSFWEHFE